MLGQGCKLLVIKSSLRIGQVLVGIAKAYRDRAIEGKPAAVEIDSRKS
jgi:hypothetical protein